MPENVMMHARAHTHAHTHTPIGICGQKRIVGDRNMDRQIYFVKLNSYYSARLRRPAEVWQGFELQEPL